jgi:hypothetical protein
MSETTDQNAVRGLRSEAGDKMAVVDLTLREGREHLKTRQVTNAAKGRVVWKVEYFGG